MKVNIECLTLQWTCKFLELKHLSSTAWDLVSTWKETIVSWKTSFNVIFFDCNSNIVNKYWHNPETNALLFTKLSKATRKLKLSWSLFEALVFKKNYQNNNWSFCFVYFFTFSICQTNRQEWVMHVHKSRLPFTTGYLMEAEEILSDFSEQKCSMNK